MVQWPRDGLPRNPGAWLMAVAKRKAVDRFRRDRTLSAKYQQLAPLTIETAPDADVDDGEIEDDRLRMMFVACHPVLPMVSRAALTLRLVGGLSTAEIARAYLQPESTVAQRIVRAKKTIAAAGVPFEVPEGEERSTRLTSVLAVIYVIFNEGYTATSGAQWTRPDLCHEALRLGRQLARLSPDEAEVHGLVALMELQSSRLAARLDPSGEVVLLADQDRRRWDQLHIHLGLAALERAEALQPEPGPYTLQAAIAACHSRAPAASKPPTGRRSSCCTSASWTRRAPRSSSSTVQWLSRWRPVRRTAFDSSTRSPPAAPSIATTCSTASEATSSTGSVATRKPPTRSRGRPRSRQRRGASLSERRARASAARAEPPGPSAVGVPAWLAGEDAEQLRWFQMPAATLADVERAIERWSVGWRDDGPVRQWGIWVDHALVGGVELRVREDGRANVSYVVFPAFRRRGHATAAVELAVAWGITHLSVDGFVAIVDERNIASRGVAERAGFTLDGPAEPWEHTESGPMLRYVFSPSRS